VLIRSFDWQVESGLEFKRKHKECLSSIRSDMNNNGGESSAEEPDTSDRSKLHEGNYPDAVMSHGTGN